ncbi:putative GTPase [bacterium HR39]|uniref:Arginine/ornithine transport system ATPase n=1 Tax=uncultured Alphaproteobacteria bacterium TaxID=91750 RepID=H5SK05_9PROT|nr:arginine/ornithine transport system ATPase [uncultured Alphaproteobacteria bacterium]GBD42311.1 putative GTPase [bacterium HR39]
MEETARRGRRLSVDAYVAGVLSGDRAALARAITLIESRHPEDRLLAERVLERLLPHTGRSHRIGISGVPGVGKSTFVDALGIRLVEQGHRLAVLAVDPTSVRTGGSILGDKTRMARLASHPNAYIRPSPSGGALGGVARTTRETILLCEAAGFDLVFVETVGVGQSEVEVAGMVDLFLVLTLPGGGDELQGIKKGILELADIIAVNKADGDNLPRAREAARQLRAALRLLEPADALWHTPVLLVSALTGAGLDGLWQEVCRHRAVMQGASAFAARRRRQQVRWFHRLLDERLERLLEDCPAVAELLPRLEREVEAGTVTPTAAVERIVAAFLAAVRASEPEAAGDPDLHVRQQP